MISLNSEQQNAISEIVDFLMTPGETEMVVEGPAGTGKSTMINHMLQVYEKQMQAIALINNIDAPHYELITTATTRKAAQVIAELTGQEALTIHSALGLKVENDRKTGKSKLVHGRNYNIIEDSIILIDEASFADSNLIKEVREGTLRCKIIWIGDPFQLASIYEPTPPIFTEGLRTAKLTQIMRNMGTVQQVSLEYRHAVDTLTFPSIGLTDDKVIHVDGATFQQMINHHFTASQLTHGNAARILAWQNDRVIQYNDYARMINGQHGHFKEGERVVTNKPIMTRSGTKYATDASGIVTDVTGTIEQAGIEGRYIELDEKVQLFVPDNQLQVRAFLKQLAKEKNWKTFFDIKENWGDLRPPYASTVHKSQGSTYDRVFIDLSDIGQCNIQSDVARMLYVAFSRASEQVVLYGALPPKYGAIQNAQGRVATVA
ncbi:ATP-dependent DNA helicase [Marinobacterium litorale]|uniref:ATP-dependent DNA helicase n=1 Tax=Marinobacterium litorale TaxID=404770 RepID=UPI00041EC127|nr:DEAD/DEAH box helicase [Marinobacterium litorale]